MQTQESKQVSDKELICECTSIEFDREMVNKTSKRKLQTPTSVTDTRILVTDTRMLELEHAMG